ncbi:MAG: hypothetical protein JW801_11755 [Bacteroidales bacterium]|nr:hypothetical protein [Bacteroidales bacterium]
MKTTKLSVLSTILLMGIGSILYGQENGTSKFAAGLRAGYNRGYGMQANLTLHNATNDLPFELRLGLGYTFLNPGKAMDARRIFINNATNGEPEKKGRSIDYRLDFLFAKSIFGLPNSYLVLGPRGSSFKGNFKYIGGNEDFDITSTQWGVGGGIESHFKMNEKLNLVIALGFDFYLPGTLYGHDTSYSPDNDNVNSRNVNENNDEPFTYKDADKAIYQPRFMPFAMIGLNFGL